MAEPTGDTITGVEDEPDYAEYADDEYGEAPSEYTTETAQDAWRRAPPEPVRLVP